MGYKTILTVLDAPDNARQIAAFGLSVAEQFSAHLIGLHAETLAAVPLIAPMEIPDPTAVQILQEAAQKETAAVAAIYQDSCAKEGVSSEWRTFTSAAGYNASSVLETARTADLIVAGQADPAHADHQADLETFLFETGRPLLLVPFRMSTPKPIRKVLVAWNGSREAARATFDALPFLKAADTVEVLFVDPPERAGQDCEMAGSDIAASLSRHDVNVTVTTKIGGDTTPAKEIERRLAESGVDLLVMGGYGHSRWWEMLFGGVTRSVLDKMTALTFVSR